MTAEVPGPKDRLRSDEIPLVSGRMLVRLSLVALLAVLLAVVLARMV